MSIPDSGSLPFRHTHTLLNKWNEETEILIQVHTYLVDKPTHPQAGREYEQSVREEDEVAFI